MISVVRTNSDNKDFIDLINLLDDDLNKRNGIIQSDYNHYNVIQSVDTVIIAYIDENPVGCGCFKKYDHETVEIKRMFVKPENRGMGISKTILSELEKWAMELEFSKSILETGIYQLEAIGLYEKSGYSRIENYGQYVGMSHSVCFGKKIKDDHIMLGLDSQKVMLAEYDSEWKSCYESESKVINNALRDLVIDIQHIGSTSVLGLKAKPIIDILVGLESFDQINVVINKMESLGYTHAYWAGIPGDYTFRKGDITTHLVHIVEYGKMNWNHNIKFRDTLKNSPALIKQYEELKEELAKKYPDSREKYTEGKSEFITAVINMKSRQ